MINALTPVANNQAATHAIPVDQKVPAAKPHASSDIQDTVHLGSAAQAQVNNIKAAVQEAEETPSQTSKEARAGDPQAQRLLARQAHAARLARGNE